MNLAIRCLALATIVLPLVAASARAQEPPARGKVELELNKLEQVDDACRIYIVLRNGEIAYESLRLDVVLFDAGGVIARRVAVGVGPLRPERPTVKLFDVENQPCDGIGTLLVNEVLECQPADVAADCLGRIEVSSRTDVEILR